MRQSCQKGTLFRSVPQREKSFEYKGFSTPSPVLSCNYISWILTTLILDQPRLPADVWEMSPHSPSPVYSRGGPTGQRKSSLDMGRKHRKSDQQLINTFLGPNKLQCLKPCCSWLQLTIQHSWTLIYESKEPSKHVLNEPFRTEIQLIIYQLQTCSHEPSRHSQSVHHTHPAKCKQNIYVTTVYQDVVDYMGCLLEHSHPPSECLVKSTVNCKRICTELTLPNSPSKPQNNGCFPRFLNTKKSETARSA